VSINKGDYTITHSSFTYYLNTQGDKCIAYGPGLLADNATSTETMFVIQARNKKDMNRESGADEFVVSIIRPDLVPVEEDEETKAKRLKEAELAALNKHDAPE